MADLQQARSHVQGRIDGTLLMVFKRYRRTEHGFDFVADKLEHQAVMGIRPMYYLF